MLGGVSTLGSLFYKPDYIFPKMKSSMSCFALIAGVFIGASACAQQVCVLGEIANQAFVKKMHFFLVCR